MLSHHAHPTSALWPRHRQLLCGVRWGGVGADSGENTTNSTGGRPGPQTLQLTDAETPAIPTTNLQGQNDCAHVQTTKLRPLPPSPPECHHLSAKALGHEALSSGQWRHSLGSRPWASYPRLLSLQAATQQEDPGQLRTPPPMASKDTKAAQGRTSRQPQGPSRTQGSVETPKGLTAGPPWGPHTRHRDHAERR